MPAAKASKKKCSHSRLSYSSSRNAFVAGYKRPTYDQRVAAATASGTLIKDAVDHFTKEKEEIHASTFPAPLVLPEDDLAWDPKYPAQSVRTWIREQERNIVTNQKRTVYLVGPPEAGEGFEAIQKLADTKVKLGPKDKTIEHPKTEDLLEYLKAFYHGLPVKLLETPKLQYTADQEYNAHADVVLLETPKRVYLNTDSKDSRVAIRVRPTPAIHNEYSHQLNLNDLLDAAIAMLPDDAYALLMLVKHDIYEDDDDDFACGRGVWRE